MTDARPEPTSTPTPLPAAPLLKRALLYTAIFAAALIVVGSIVGWLVAGVAGLVSALIAAVMTVVFFGLTALTVLVASKVAQGQLFSGVFFAIVLGGWLLKFLIFFALVVVLSRQDFVDPYVFFVTIVVAVIGSLCIDVLAFQRARLPYTDVQLPPAPSDDSPSA